MRVDPSLREDSGQIDLQPETIRSHGRTPDIVAVMQATDATDGESHPTRLDDPVDAGIVREISRDARATLADISKAVGLSVSAVQTRLRRLESRGRDRRLPGGTGCRGHRAPALGVHRDHAARSGAARQRARAARAPDRHRGLPLHRRRRELHALREGRDTPRPRGADPRHPAGGIRQHANDGRAADLLRAPSDRTGGRGARVAKAEGG